MAYSQQSVREHWFGADPRHLEPLRSRFGPAIIKAAMLTEVDILTALRNCYDPVLPCNIVDLGLVRRVRVAPDPEAPGAGIPGVPQKHCIEIELVLSHPSEQSEAQVTEQIRNRLAGMEQAGAITISMTSQPVWTPQQITPEGRRILGLDGNPNLVQIR